MDASSPVTHVSLCAGYGGIDLGLKRAIPSLRTIAFSEVEAFAVANLVAKMEAGLLDPAPVWSNLKTFPWGKFHGCVDILSGGYPCQPFSAAGKRLGADDPRHLWPFIADGIRLMRPELCFFENVEGHISLGLREVVGELEAIGYRTTWGIFGAAEVGAPHQRKRVFILADRYGQRGFLSHWRQLAAEQMPFCNGAARRNVWPSRPGEPQHAWEPPRVVAHTGGPRTNTHSEEVRTRDDSIGQSSVVANSQRYDDGRSNGLGWGQRKQNETSEAGVQRYGDGQAKPAMGGDADGSPGRLGYAELCVSCDNRTDELRLLGNGVVPATAELAFRTLINRLT